jgi:uncharacterized protein YgiM (DUF1202 family)
MAFRVGDLVKVITQSGLNIRERADVGSTKLGAIPQGTVVPVIGDSTSGPGAASWVKVAYSGVEGWIAEGDGQTAWVSGAQPRDVATIEPGVYTVTGSNVNLRDQPSLQANVIIMTGPANETVLADGQAQDGFAHVTYRNNVGWMSRQYLAKQGTIDPASLLGPIPKPDLVQVKQDQMPSEPTQKGGAPAPSAGVLVGGLLALALVVYFLAK